ncbi:MAG TPA: AraC family transcriptional regulator [Rhizomicrobium sp.]|nr:AraC family transcriptional regulator [Rhizomicrobium sp.]
MSLTNKALWVIERNLNRELTLAGIAEGCEVSRYHLAHAFGSATGRSVMEYARGRRLTEAARALASGAPDILAVALDTGYASHEAFSRAFRAQFATTPEDLRRKASLDGVALIDALRLPAQGDASLEPPEIVPDGPLHFIGLSQRTSFGTADKTVPAQWRRFMAEEYERIADKAEAIPVGVYTNLDDDGNFDFVTAAEVERASDVPKGLVKVTVPKQTYAVFQHRGHVSTIGQTYDAIWNDWLPFSQWKSGDGASLERANPTFDPRTGNGGHTIWIPVVG